MWGVKAAGLDSLISNDISLQLPNWEGAEEGNQSLMPPLHLQCSYHVQLHLHQRTVPFTTITPPPTDPVDVRASSPMHIITLP